MSDDLFPTDEGTGGGVQALDGKIADFFFQDGEYGCSICVKIMFDDPENYPTFEGGTYTQWYPMGQDFHAAAGGDTVEGPRNWNRRFDAGRLLFALSQVPGIADTLSGTGWTHTDAKSWKGLHLHWERSSYTRKSYAKDAAGNRIPDPNRAGKDLLVDVEQSILLPVALLDDQLTLGSNGAGTVDVQSLNLTGEQVTLLAKAANEATGGPAFIGKVVEIDATLMSGTPLAAALSKDAEAVRVALAAEII